MLLQVCHLKMLQVVFYLIITCNLGLNAVGCVLLDNYFVILVWIWSYILSSCLPFLLIVFPDVYTLNYGLTFMKMEDKHSFEVIHCQGNRIKSLPYISHAEFKTYIGFIHLWIKKTILNKFYIPFVLIYIAREY